jgi:hypothetical protein
MKANMREKIPLVLYNELKNNYEKKIYTELCIHDVKQSHNTPMEA